MWNSKKKREEMMNMIRMIQPTSKLSVSQQCLLIAKGDIDEAKKLRDYFTDVMDDLPAVDPPPTTVMGQTKEIVGDFFGWIKNNQNAIATGYEMIRQMTGGKLPPLTLPGMAAAPEPTAEPLPPINE